MFVVVLQNPSVMAACVAVIDNNALLFLTLVMFMVVAMMEGTKTEKAIISAGRTDTNSIISAARVRVRVSL